MTTPNHRVPPVLALTLCALGTACLTTSGPLGDLEDDGAADGMAEDSADGPGGSATSTGGGDGGDVGESDDGEEPIPACTQDIGSSAGRALDGVRWHNAVADLVGVQSTPPSGLSSNSIAYPSPTPAEIPAEIYAAEAGLVADAADVAALLSCAPETESPEADACIESFASTLGRLAWRGALGPDELDGLTALEPGGTAEARARAVIEALLASPRFWTIDESGTPDPEDAAITLLDQHAIASRLAFFLWNSIPDDALLARAEAGELSDATVRAAEVDRLLADARAARAIGDLWEAVLLTRDLEGGQHDPGLFPQMDATLAASMRKELRRFAADVVLTEGTWPALLSATRSFVDGPLAAGVYDGDIVGTAPAGSDFEPVQFDPDRRPGILTRAAPLASATHPSALGTAPRGLLVRQRLLCSPVPPPPPDIDVVPPTPDGLDRYELLDQHADDATCAGCHNLFDPITPALDNYDPIGQWQTQITAVGGPASSGDPTVPVNTSGELVAVGVDGEFETLAEMLALLGTAPESLSCQVENQLVYAFGRRLGAEDECTVETLSQAFAQSGGDFRQLAHDIVASDVFVRVRPE